MSKENPEKGYYSILQYVPNAERAESVNIGIVLFCPNSKFFKIQYSPDNNRARKLFGNEVINAEYFNMFKLAFEERIKAASKNFLTLEDFQYFVGSRASLLQLTNPRPVKVFDPHEEVKNLYNLLVIEHHPKVSGSLVLQKPAIIKQFKDLIKLHSIEDKVRKDYPIPLNPSSRPLKYPFAFQNGMLNVIQPEPFGASSIEENLNKAFKLALESKGLNHLDTPVKLNIIGSFRPDQKESIPEIQKILEQCKGRLYSVEKLEPLIQEIKTQAHE